MLRLMAKSSHFGWIWPVHLSIEASGPRTLVIFFKNAALKWHDKPWMSNDLKCTFFMLTSVLYINLWGSTESWLQISNIQDLQALL